MGESREEQIPVVLDATQPATDSPRGLRATSEQGSDADQAFERTNGIPALVRYESDGVDVIKISGLLPLKLDPEKDILHTVSRQLYDVCDEVIILHDNPDLSLGPPRTDIGLAEEIVIQDGKSYSKWHDWSNRMALYARAAKYECQWAMLQDADETLGPTITRARVRGLCEQADANGQVAVIVRVRTAWSDTHWRTDGVFGNQSKPLLVKNPLMLKNPNFMWTPEKRLHGLPRLEGPVLWVDDFIVHHGMRTRSLREKNVAKYAAADSNNEFSSIPYDYLLNEDSATFELLTA